MMKVAMIDRNLKRIEKHALNQLVNLKGGAVANLAQRSTFESEPPQTGNQEDINEEPAIT